MSNTILNLRRQLSHKDHSWLYALALVLILNIGFSLVLFLSSLMPFEVIVHRIKAAFSTGELIANDYLPYDVHRGFHQYNDCNILQMMTNQDSSPVARALGPWLYMADSSATEACRSLQELVVDGRDPKTFSASRYTRYWHGYIPILRGLLMFLDLATLRAILRIGVYTTVFLVLFSSIREKHLLLLTGPVFVVGVLFWGLPYFGQGMSHAPGDSVVMLGIACILFWHRQFTHASMLIPFCALFGAMVVYFEMLTGPLPIAAGLLFPAVYSISRLTRPDDTSVYSHFHLGMKALMAFSLGAIVTVGIRVVLAATLVQPSGLDTFAGNLSLYTQPVDSTSFIPGFLRPLGRLIRRGLVLTYGSHLALALLYTSVASSWCVSAWLAHRAASCLRWGDLIAFVIGASSVPVWTFIMQTHTFIHADFMTRILIVPISLGWAAMFWQLWMTRTPTPEHFVHG